MEYVRAWTLNLTNPVYNVVPDEMNIVVDAPPTVDMCIEVKKQYAGKGVYKKLLEDPSTAFKQILKDLGVMDKLVAGPFAVKKYKVYFEGKLKENAGVRANLVVEIKPNANFVESISGKMGAFVRTFNDNKHPVVPVEEQMLENLLVKVKKLDQNNSRGVVTTRAGLATRVTKEGLAETRKFSRPEDSRYEGAEGVCGDIEYNATSFPRCMTKEDVADLLRTKCGWKVLVIKPIQDKFDRNKKSGC